MTGLEVVLRRPEPVSVHGAVVKAGVAIAFRTRRELRRPKVPLRRRGMARDGEGWRGMARDGEGWRASLRQDFGSAQSARPTPQRWPWLSRPLLLGSRTGLEP